MYYPVSNLIFVSTQVGFSRILSPVRIPGIDKGIFKMGNNTNSVVAQGLSEFRCVCFINLIPVIDLDYILIYLVLIDDSRASVYLRWDRPQNPSPFGTSDGGLEQ